DRQRALVVDRALGPALGAVEVDVAELDAGAVLALVVGEQADEADVAVVDAGVLAALDVARIAERALAVDGDADVGAPGLALDHRHRGALLAPRAVLQRRIALAAVAAVLRLEEAVGGAPGRRRRRRRRRRRAGAGLAAGSGRGRAAGGRRRAGALAR